MQRSIYTKPIHKTSQVENDYIKSTLICFYDQS